MSRSGYGDEGDQWDIIRWRGQVASAIRGKRGQAFLRELRDSLDAMPEKRLIAHELQSVSPAFVPPEHAVTGVCAIGSVGQARGVDMTEIDPEDHRTIGKTFNIADPLSREIMWVNDDDCVYVESPESRWCRVRAWVSMHILQSAEPKESGHDQK